MSPLITEQIRTLLVMMGAGILVESLWQGRCLLLQRLRRPAAGEIRGAAESASSDHPRMPVKFSERHPWKKTAIHTVVRSPRLHRAIIDIHFWIAAAFVLSMFLYYCAWGKLSVHAGLGFFVGLLLWKKMCCAIIRT